MSSSFRSRAALAGATLASTLFATGRVHAANWEFDPRVEVGGQYNDNYRLEESGTPKIPAYGPLVDAALGIGLIDPRGEIEIMPRVHSSFFPDDHEDQSTDGYLTIDGKYSTQRATFGGTASYSNETVISSELLPADFPGVNLGQVVGEATGRVSIHNRRVLEQIAPKMTYDFTPRYHLDLNAVYESASFSNNLTGLSGLTQAEQAEYIQVGFKDAYGSVGLQYDITQRQDIVFRLLAAQFIPDSVTNVGGGVDATQQTSSSTDTERYGVEGQWDAKPTDTIQTYVRIGVNDVHANTAVDGIINKTLLVGGAGVVWTYQLSQYVLDAIRDLSPSAAGAVVEHDEARFRVIRALRPRFYTVIAARVVRVRGASQAILGVQGSDYVAASVALQYQLTQNYRISTEYDYTWQRFEGEPYAASNGIAVSVIWQPQSRFKPLPNYNALPLDRPQ